MKGVETRQSKLSKDNFSLYAEMPTNKRGLNKWGWRLKYSPILHWKVEKPRIKSLGYNEMMKGTTAGTTLRGMFSRLAKPTEKAQEIMDELGITVYDNEGKFRSISDIIGIVTEKTSGLSEQEKNFALSTIFGKSCLPGNVERLCA